MDVERMTRMFQNDASGSMQNTLRVAQSDIMNLLCDFMDVKRLDMRIDKDGESFKLTITADVDKIYDVGKITL